MAAAGRALPDRSVLFWRLGGSEVALTTTAAGPENPGGRNFAPLLHQQQQGCLDARETFPGEGTRPLQKGARCLSACALLGARAQPSRLHR